MGSLLARLRKKVSTADELDRIQKELKNIDEFQRSTQASHKKIIGHLLAYFTVVYFLSAIFVYTKYFYHPAWQDFLSQLKLLLPFLVTPFIYMTVKGSLGWWYRRKTRKNEVALTELRKKKTQLLNDVMEKETYKVAKELIEKYAPEQLPGQGKLQKSGVQSSLVTSTPSRQQQQQSFQTRSPPESGLRRRNPPSLPAAPVGTPVQPQNRSLVANRSQINPPSGARGSPGGPPLGPPLPRPVLPRERGYMDRMVEYLVGDGPSNRYALICIQCQSHNGMALREEFEYIAYRCCYCHYWNPARKQRLTAPKLDNFETSRNQTSTESSSEEEIAVEKEEKDDKLEVKDLEGKNTENDTNEKDLTEEKNPNYMKTMEIKN